MKNCKIRSVRAARNGTISSLLVLSLAGCTSVSSSFGTLFEGDRVDYKSAEKRPTANLEVPPDLTQLQRDNRYALPESARGTATASGQGATQQAAAKIVPVVAPKATTDMRIERAGSQRWLVIKKTPEDLWPQIKDFWQDSGFLINIENADAGVMETDWAENRAKIPQDLIRRTLGKFLDAVYSTGERDKFRTRLERNSDGWTEIYVSHRGAQEVSGGVGGDNLVWSPRPSDPELEAEFLGKLMARLGSEETKARQEIASAQIQAPRSKIVRGEGAARLEVNESFDRAWRRVGLALDRVGFTVEDRDRTQGTYFVRYVDQVDDSSKKTAEKGIMSRLFSFGSKPEKTKTANRYRVNVKGTGDASQVVVQNNEGRTETSATADRILALLNEQLK